MSASFQSHKIKLLSGKIMCTQKKSEMSPFYVHSESLAILVIVNPYGMFVVKKFLRIEHCSIFNNFNPGYGVQ